MPLHTTIHRFVSEDGRWWTNIAAIKERVHVYSGRVGGRTIDYDPSYVRGSVMLKGDTASDIEFACQKLIHDGYREVFAHPVKSGTSSLAKTWYQIESWLDVHVPGSSEWPLSNGADAGELKDLESLIGARLPKDMRESYLRHNGSNDMCFFRFIGGGHWSPLTEVARSWTFFQDNKSDFAQLEPDEPIGPIKRVGFSDGWIPIADNGCGDHLCIDLDPPKGGKRGQVFSYWHEYGAWRIVAPSFEAMLKKLATRLKKGRYVITKDGELGLHRKVSVGKQIDIFQGSCER